MFQSTLNPNTLNDFSQDAAANQMMGAVNGNRALMCLYSPHYMPEQVLRSYVYQFTPQFVDALNNVGNSTTLEQAVSGNNSKYIPGATTAIMPDSEGKMADTANWNHMWTFTLIIDLLQTQFNGLPVPSCRKIASGYIYGGEAGTYDFAGNFLVNPNAIIVFTRVTNLQVRRSFNPNTPSPDGWAVYPETIDYAGESIPAFYNEDMFIGTPRDLAQQKFSSADGLVNYTELSLAKSRDGATQVRSIPNELKSPKHQLSEIMRAIDNGIDAATNAPASVYDKMCGADEHMSVIDNALGTISDNLPTSNMFDIVTGIDTGRPYSFSELESMYPNMEVKAFVLRNRESFGWSVAPQVGLNASGALGPVMSPKQEFSSLAASVVQSICSSLGIATLAFSYRWLDGDGFVAGKTEAFQLERFDLMVPRDVSVGTQIANRMKMYLDDQLFEIIHSCVGEFEINVLCDAAGTILVDLRLYNFPDNQDGAYYQTDSKFGGITNPMIGTLNTISNNAMQIADTAQNLVGVSMARQDFPTQPTQPMYM